MDVFFRRPTVIAPKPPTLVFVQGQPSSMQFALCARSSHGTRRVGFVLPERSGQPDSHQPDWVEPLIMYQKLGVMTVTGKAFAIGQSGRWARDLDLPLQNARSEAVLLRQIVMIQYTQFVPKK